MSLGCESCRLFDCEIRINEYVPEDSKTLCEVTKLTMAEFVNKNTGRNHITH